MCVLKNFLENIFGWKTLILGPEVEAETFLGSENSYTASSKGINLFY